MLTRDEATRALSSCSNPLSPRHLKKRRLLRGLCGPVPAVCSIHLTFPLGRGLLRLLLFRLVLRLRLLVYLLLLFSRVFECLQPNGVLGISYI